VYVDLILGASMANGGPGSLKFTTYGL